jgi:phosphodiesterase/alkaline phosphatase D-like protein
VRNAGSIGRFLLLLLIGVAVGYSQTGSLSVATNDATSIVSRSAVLNGTVTPGDNSVGVWFEWGTTSSLGTKTSPQVFSPGKTATFTASLSNLQAGTTYFFRAVLYPAVAGAPNVNGDIKTFTTTGTAVPAGTIAALTLDATSLSSNSATLNGSVNPGGGGVTAWFDWGTSSSFGNRTDVQSIAASTTVVPVAFSLKNLQPHTLYYFRLDAYRASDGTAALGDIKSFTTSDAPNASSLTVTTMDATGVTSTGATLNGKIVGGGANFYAWFEYGSTSSLGSKSDPQAFNQSTTTVSLTKALNNLSPNTTYYFRIVGYLGGGVLVSGDVLSFTTPVNSSAAVSITSSEASGITSTSATLKADVNAAGSIVAYFEWGTTSALGTLTTYQTFPAGNDITFSKALTNLQPNTAYYFRAVAGTSTTNLVRSDIISFKTASGTSTTLSLTTLDAGTVSSASAVLQGIINPAGTASTAWFEWGTSTPLPNKTTAQQFSGSDPSNYSFSLSSLQPNTHYYYRAVAQNSAGTVTGDYKAFTTTRVPSTVPQTGNVESGQIQTGYVIVTPGAASDSPSVTFTYGTISQGVVQAQAGMVPNPMGTDASMFVEVIPSISRNIGVAMTNPGSTAIAVTLTLRDQTGLIVGSPANVTIPAQQQVARLVSDLFGADVISSGIMGSLRMQSASPFAVVGLRFAGTAFSTLPVVVTSPVPGVPSMTLTAGSDPNSPAAGTAGGTTSLIIPQFAISGGWATTIALVNNTNATLVGRIDIFDQAGNPLPVNLNGDTRSTFTYSIPAGGTFILSPVDSNGQSPL